MLRHSVRLFAALGALLALAACGDWNATAPRRHCKIDTIWLYGASGDSIPNAVMKDCR